MQPKASLPSVSALLSSSYGTVKARFKALFAAIGIVVALQGLFIAATPFIRPWIQAINHAAGGGVALIVAILFMMSTFALALFQVYSAAVVIKFVLNGSDEKGSLSAAYGQTALLFLGFIWMMILEGLMVFGASVFLIVPALILGVYVSLAGFVLLDGQAKGISALAYSARLIQGYWWAVFGRTLLISLLNSLCAWLITAAILAVLYAVSGGGDLRAFFLGSQDLRSLAFQIGSIVPTMFMIAYMAELYRSLKGIKGSSPEAPLAPERVHSLKGPFIGMAVWGLVSGLAVMLAFSALIVFSALAIARERAGATASNEGYFGDLMGTSTVSYVDPAGKFSIGYPNTWQVSVEGDTTYFIAPIRSAQSLSRGSVMVTVFPVPAGTSLDAFAQEARDSFTKNPDEVAAGRVIVKEEKTSLGGVPGVTFYTSKKRSFDGGTTYITQVSEETFLVHGATAYNVAYKNNVIEYASLRPTGLSVVDSFKPL